MRCGRSCQNRHPGCGPDPPEPSRRTGLHRRDDLHTRPRARPVVDHRIAGCLPAGRRRGELQRVAAAGSGVSKPCMLRYLRYQADAWLQARPDSGVVRDRPVDFGRAAADHSPDCWVAIGCSDYILRDSGDCNGYLDSSCCSHLCGWCWYCKAGAEAGID